MKKSFLVTGEITVQYAVWIGANDEVKAEEAATLIVKQEINSDKMKVVGRPRNVEVKHED